MRITELDWGDTPWGVISLRRRWDRLTDREVYEVKLDDDFLMSSQFTHGEEELARIGLGALEGSSLTVLVGGLGLGYTAVAALADPRVGELTVVEAIEQVLSWHERDLLPDTAGLASDARVRLVRDDFFDLVRAGRADRRYDAVLLDIDHAPDRVLRSDHADLYTAAGFLRVAAMLGGRGAFALWSDEPPQQEVLDRMTEAFEEATAHVVTFPNPITGGTSANTVYLAVRPRR